MLPSRLPEQTGSRAERQVFEKLAHEGRDNWTVLHSLGLLRHQRKPWAEADFVLVTPEGIFVLEVKGGAVRRIERQWWTNESRLKESPFDQAAGAAAALFRDLESHCPAIRRAVVGSGVCFPDVAFDASSTDVEPELLYDARDADRSFADYVDRLVAFWRGRIRETRRVEWRPLSPNDMEAIVARLAGDFALVPSLRGYVGGVTRSLVRLTDEQIEGYWGLEDNPRVVVRGPAGTGKTLIAAADARRSAERGLSVLFVCASNALRDHLAAQLDALPNITVRAFGQLCSELIHRAAVRDPWPSGAGMREYYDVLRPTAALEALCTMANPPVFDVLIVDEAQDLLTGPAADVLDMVVSGGWDGGIWRLFLDPVQDVFENSHSEVVDRLDRLAVRWRLRVNCRNTAQIARDTAIAVGTDIQATLPVDGPEAVWLPYHDEREHRRLVARQLREWLESGLRPEQLTILSLVRRENSVLADGLPPGVGCRLVDGPLAEARRRGAVQFCTVAAFKGLESDAVLLLDAQLGRRDRAEGLYVAMTRPRALLAVLRSQRLDSVWASLQRDFGRRLVSASL
jgi:hypothetical protein